MQYAGHVDPFQLVKAEIDSVSERLRRGVMSGIPVLERAAEYFFKARPALPAKLLSACKAVDGTRRGCCFPQPCMEARCGASGDLLLKAYVTQCGSLRLSGVSKHPGVTAVQQPDGGGARACAAGRGGQAPAADHAAAAGVGAVERGAAGRLLPVGGFAACQHPPGAPAAAWHAACHPQPLLAGCWL